MQSRSKKSRQSFDDYQQAIEKQLHDDFQVNQYLNQNQLEGNIEEYLKLVNSLQVTNNQKKKKYDTLQVSYHQMNTDRMEKSLKLSRISDWDGAKQTFIKQFQQTQIKTSNQIEVKNNLWSQIIQTKKSLNLLKGDIGHLVSRNQSATILESKISKVKIVADDQLKRVSLAYSKDKQEIKERKDMQRKFNKKLKNVSMFEDSSLNKLKRNYINTMVRKKQMHDRLTYIEKIGSSIQKAGDKQLLKNIINKNTLEMYRNFEKLRNLIEKIPQLQEEYENSTQRKQNNFLFSVNEFVNEMNSFCCIQSKKTSESYFRLGKSRNNIEEIEHINSSDLQMVNEQNLNKFQQLIKLQYSKLTEQIQRKTTEYDFKVKKSQELTTKLYESNQEINQIQLDLLDQANSKFLLTPSMKEPFIQKLKRFIQIIKTLFALLEFIEKHLNYSLKLQQNHQKKLSHTRSIQHRGSLAVFKPDFVRSNSNQQKKIPSNNSLIITHKNYVSDLHKIYYTLLKNDSETFKLEDINLQIFNLLNTDIQIWLNLIKNKFVEGKGFVRPSKHRNSYCSEKQENLVTRHVSKIRGSLFSNPKKAKTFIQVEEEQINEVKQQYQEYLQNFNKRYATIHNQNPLNRHNSVGILNDQNNLFKSTINFLLMKGLQSSKIANVQKLKNSSISTTFQNHKQAKRIKFLQDLDKDYYKPMNTSNKTLELLSHIFSEEYKIDICQNAQRKVQGHQKGVDEVALVRRQKELKWKLLPLKLTELIQKLANHTCNLCHGKQMSENHLTQYHGIICSIQNMVRGYQDKRFRKEINREIKEIIKEIQSRGTKRQKTNS